MSVLEMIGDEDMLMDFKKMLLTIIEVQEYIKNMLDKLSGRHQDSFVIQNQFVT